MFRHYYHKFFLFIIVLFFCGATCGIHRVAFDLSCGLERQTQESRASQNVTSWRFLRGSFRLRYCPVHPGWATCPQEMSPKELPRNRAHQQKEIGNCDNHTMIRLLSNSERIFWESYVLKRFFH